LRKLSVGALAGHLYLTVRRVRIHLEGETVTTDAPVPASLGRYYASMRIVSDDDLGHVEHARIREDGERVAARGHATVAMQFAREVERIRPLVAAAPADRPIALGTQRFALSDYLATRVVEAAIHVDDLAVSCDLDVTIDADALALAVDVLVGAAREESGDLAVLRALARRERNTADVLRVL